MTLDLTSLRKAVDSLARALNVAVSEKMQVLDKDQQVTIKAGVIQNFEFTYELCWKFMKRWLENNLGSVYIDGVSRRELFRLSAEHQLIRDVDTWMEYHGARNQTLHTYDEQVAQDVLKAAELFLYDAEKLLKNLEDKND